jgi:hypothetical protein
VKCKIKLQMHLAAEGAEYVNDVLKRAGVPRDIVDLLTEERVKPWWLPEGMLRFLLKLGGMDDEILGRTFVEVSGLGCCSGRAITLVSNMQWAHLKGNNGISCAPSILFALNGFSLHGASCLVAGLWVVLTLCFSLLWALS